MSGRVLIRAGCAALILTLATAVQGRAADAAAFAHQLAARYHVDARRVITADIDRDGDLDVVAATDDGFIVWVNDGAGQFTSQPPQPRPLVDGLPPCETWDGGESLDNETIQSDSIPLVVVYGHAPPENGARSTASFDVVVCRTPARGSCIPRAPPLV